MQQHHAIILELASDRAKIFIIAADADMLEHSHRDNPIEGLVDVAVILQPEVQALGES